MVNIKDAAMDTGPKNLSFDLGAGEEIEKEVNTADWRT